LKKISQGKPEKHAQIKAALFIISDISFTRNVFMQTKRSDLTELESKKNERIAIPISGGKLAGHFAHCEEFAFIDLDPQTKKIVKKESVQAPPHQPGLLPPWLAGHGVSVIIAGGMGMKARQLFESSNIKVVLGVSVESPENIVKKYLEGTLRTGENPCDH